MKVSSYVAVVCALLLSSTAPVAAQGVEAIMRARETLALTEDQISRLDAIRKEIVAQRSTERAEMEELRSQLSAGQIRQSQLMAAQEARADAAQGRAEAIRTRIDAVLTEEQRASLESMRARTERVGARRGFAPGGRVGIGRGFGPGGAGRGGFAPGGPGGAGPDGFGPVGPRGGRRGGGGFGL
jgi:Spy/CpxP family protein refolding chaperone